MKIEEKRVMLKNGQSCVLRSPELTDAEQLVKLVRIMAEETDFVIRYPEEADIPAEQEEFFLKYLNDAERDMMVVAEVEGEIAGSCQISEVGKSRIKVRHRCTCALGMYRKYWGIGIGTAMLELLAEKALELGYEQMELDVFSGNERAVGLYKKMGFVKTGVIPDGIRYKDGTFDGLDIMVKKLRRVK